MKKRETTIFNYTDFFGTIKKYHIWAVKSSLDLYPFSMAIQRNCKCQFSYLGEYTPPESPYKPVFKMMYAEISGINHYHVVILENRTVDYNTSFSETKTGMSSSLFQLSLFQTPFFLLHHKMPALFSVPSDVPLPLSSSDYLIFIYSNKDNKADDFLERLRGMSGIESADISSILNSTAKGSKPKVKFFQELFYTMEIEANNFLQKKDKKLLGEIHKIKSYNLVFKPDTDLPPIIDKDHLRLLEIDSSFE